MPLYDFECESGHVTEDMVKSTIKEIPCPTCGQPANRVWLKAPDFDWGAMGAQRNVSPEFTERFERVHKQQLDKEKKSMENHGDYGPRPGA